MITKIFLALVIVIVIILVAAYLTPRDFRLSKSATIDAPREKIYDYIRFLKSQENYSVWVMTDPNIQLQYTGIGGTVGSASSWTSEMKNVGIGAQKIKALIPNEAMTVEIRFEKPFKATNFSDIALEDIGEQTKVTNTFYGKSKFPMNITNLFLDKMVGRDMLKNMENLKKIMEQK